MLIVSVVAFCFYKSYYAILLFAPVFPFYYSYREKMEDRKHKEKLRLEFKEFITLVASSLSAGYSMENALKSAEKELSSLIGEKAEMMHALRIINRRISINEPVEKILLGFAKNTGIDDIESFSEIFAFAKRSGGDYAGIMKRTASILQDKIETSRDIQTVISQKKMEARIMDLVPIGIILYLQISSPEFLSGLYHNLMGIVVMTVCLVVYILAVFMGEKIVDIRF